MLDGGTLLDVYETGTKLNGLGGQQVDGEFDTTIVRPGNIFWLKEVSAGPGYSWGDRPQIIAFVPADQLGSFELDENGFYVRADETKVKVVPYEKNATVTADAFNYDMSGTGEGEINTAYVKPVSYTHLVPPYRQLCDERGAALFVQRRHGQPLHAQ